MTAITQLTGVTGVRLEVLPDDSLSSKGPGRAPNGSWVLSEFKMLGDGRPVELTAARSDFDQPGWPLANALDGQDSTGWGTWPQVGQAHEAIFDVRTPFGYRPDRLLSFRLQFRSQFKQHVIGRFRISITNSPLALLRPVPDEVKDALAVDTAERNDAQKKAIADFYLASEPRLIAAQKESRERQAGAGKSRTRGTAHDGHARARAAARKPSSSSRAPTTNTPTRSAMARPPCCLPLPADAPQTASPSPAGWSHPTIRSPPG
ncbi:MAG: discoidin domain-containing protein [Chthoniobacter sp.]